MPDKMKSFEAAMQELEALLEKMSDEGTSLQESIACYTKAAALLESSYDILQKAEVRVREIDEKIDAIRETE